MKQKAIKKVLMCKPLYFSSLDYVINPWMTPGTIDNTQAMREWTMLVTTYNNLGIQVESIDQQKDAPDMVFAADQGIVQGKNVILSRFWHKERRRETKHYEQWFRDHKYQIKQLPADVYFEGNGNAFFWNDIIFMGVGYRADKKALKTIAKIFDREVIAIEAVDPRFYHLDVGFLPLDSETAFYYPPAFSATAKKQLKKYIPQLLELTKEEAFGFCGNSVVTGNTVIHQAGNPTLVKKLQDLGYNSVEVDLSEFKKSGGGAHCLTNILEMETT